MKTITHWKECKEQFPTLNDDQAHHVSKLYESYHKGVSMGGVGWYSKIRGDCLGVGVDASLAHNVAVQRSAPWAHALFLRDENV